MDHSNYYKITEKIHSFLDNHELKGNDVVVFDIDDTLLCPVRNQLITPVVEVYHKCVAKKIPIILITARQRCNYTEEQLSSHGLTHHDYTFFMPRYGDNVFEYKRGTRKNITIVGYNIICSIGDMYWDCGDYGGKSFVLTERV
jgi:hypothetical protein